jgi:hypothetical protein
VAAVFAWQPFAKHEGSALTLIGPMFNEIYIWCWSKGQWRSFYDRKQLPDKIFQFSMRVEIRNRKPAISVNVGAQASEYINNETSWG